MAEPLRHRQTKGAETDMPSLPPPRHIPTLPVADTQHRHFLSQTRRASSGPRIKALDHFLVRPVERRSFGWRRRGLAEACLAFGVLHHVEQHLGCAPIGARGFVDQLMDDGLALGDPATFPIDRDVHRLAQRIGQERREVLPVERAFPDPVDRGGESIKCGARREHASSEYQKGVDRIA
jgi:hypothetical protein